VNNTKPMLKGPSDDTRHFQESLLNLRKLTPETEPSQMLGFGLTFGTDHRGWEFGLAWYYWQNASPNSSKRVPGPNAVNIPLLAADSTIASCEERISDVSLRECTNVLMPPLLCRCCQI
jgi:hypothetical protein